MINDLTIREKMIENQFIQIKSIINYKIIKRYRFVEHVRP